jgi:hypothetical protein
MTLGGQRRKALGSIRLEKQLIEEISDGVATLARDAAVGAVGAAQAFHNRCRKSVEPIRPIECHSSSASRLLIGFTI